MAALGDRAAPSSFKRFIDDNVDRATIRNKCGNQQLKQYTADREPGPIRTIKHVMVRGPVLRLVQVHLAQGGCDRVPATRQQRSNEKDEDLAIRGTRTRWLKVRQDQYNGWWKERQDLLAADRCLAIAILHQVAQVFLLPLVCSLRYDMYKVELERVMKDGGFKLIPAQICAADLAVAKVLQGWDGVRMLVLSKHSNDVVGILTPFILI